MSGKATKHTKRRSGADLARAESEQRFRLMADNAPVMIWVADTENKGTFFNKPWLDFTGRSLDEERGDGWLQAIHPDDVETCAATCCAEFAARRPFTMEFRMRAASGEYRWVLDQGVPLYGDDGTFEGYIGSCVDITSRKEVERQRDRLLELEQRARRDAEEASRLKDEFLATLSHELRTPLNAVLGWSRLIVSGKVSGEQAQRAVEVIERNAQAQAQLIEDLLDVSRVVTGKLQIEPRRVTVGPIVEAAIDAMRPALDAKQIRLDVSLEAASGRVFGDASRLQQVVWNLLSNAVKFTPSHGAVGVELSRSGSRVRLVVRDTGHGIEPDFLVHVFDRFRQADGTTTRAHTGLGLGLAIVRHIVELHGGTVEATSDGTGRGAAFTVELPLDEHVPPGAPGTLATTAGSPGRRLAGVSILVVDDERDTRDLLSTLFEREGAFVRASASSADAFEAVQSWRPDVVVSDISLPGEDGLTLARRIRGLAPEDGGLVPAVALTGYAQIEARERALAAGFQLYVTKPVEPARLVATIATLLRETRERGPGENG